MSYFGIPIRNGLPIGLGSVAPLASGGGSPFSPASLFSGGAPGVWYDPSDYGATGTLFQDSAGTTPVTAVEQPVGLMLDKSQGLVLGPELVTNGDFSGGATTGWTSVSGGVLTVDAGRLKVTNGVANVGGAEQVITTVAGTMYEFSVTQSNGNSGAGRVYIGTSSGAVNLYVNYSASGVITVKFFATTTTTYINLRTNSFTASDFVYFDNISVKELAGNHAFQSTSASRPVLSARYNLLERTEDFANAYWGKSAITLESSTVTAPDGSATAVRFSNTAATSTHRLASNAFASGLNRMTLWAKAGTASFISINRASTDFQAIFDLSNGTVSSIAGCTATIVAADNGFYQLTVTPTSVTSQFFCVNFATTAANAAAGASFLGAGETMIIWHPDARVNNNGITQPTYQRVNTATDYATTGFLPYLKFDGVDDSLSTNSISFTSTDKMSVFAGVRKLSDAAIGAIVGLSSSPVGNNGAFEVLGPAGAGSTDYRWTTRGTATATMAPTGFAAPITNVLTGIADIGADIGRLRINGVQVDTSPSDQGTGNYGNYPLYIGRRGGSSLPFNGQLYSMVIVGKAVTAGELTSTETYVNQKTGAY